MEIRYVKNSGHSLIMWTVLFGLVIATLALLRGNLKMVLQRKMMNAADFVIWTYGGQGVDFHVEKDSKSKTIRSQQQITTKVESRPGIIKTRTQTSPSNRDRSVSISAPEDAETLLNSLDPDDILK